MKKKEKPIEWNSDGWTIVQEADAEKHILEISCRAENGVVVEVCRRHGDGEEEKLGKNLDGVHKLPMSLEEFKTAIENKTITLK